MKLKIALRQTEHPPLPRQKPTDTTAQILKGDSGLGRSDGTIRFLFEPPNIEGYGI